MTQSKSSFCQAASRVGNMQEVWETSCHTLPYHPIGPSASAVWTQVERVCRESQVYDPAWSSSDVTTWNRGMEP